ncbi:AP2-like ethylene-responsive transcription factor AIL1 [Papaver somniferum]|uniref:AP2-like ethylene-responsive transcription factor AIL1 n=1 Tax=Papaver somniferum TaxID=3469 RepID=UPI000E6FDC18|nr:AP2-like ethylene-responsive transcription factor AIL1 [Papaver somniferum]
MKCGDSTSRGEISPQLLDLNSEWVVEGDSGGSDERRIFGGSEERKLELKLGPPCEVNKIPISLLFTSTLTSTTTTNNTSHFNYTKRQKISQYRGVTRDIRKAKYKAQFWDGSCRKEGIRKGKQVYLGVYDEEDTAAKAYDLAALKYLGPTARINFPLSNYQKEIIEMENMKKEEYVATLKRKSTGFSRGVSMYKGVRRCGKRWQAVIKSAANKRSYLGTFGTQQEAAEVYDIAAIKSRGASAVTNFPTSNYDVEHICSNATLIGGDITKHPSPQNSSSSIAAIENESVVVTN